MTQEINLKELELKAWTSVFQDGLYDLFLGWLILWMGIIFIIDDTGLSSPVLLAINMGGYLSSVALLYLGKHYITTPRTGRVRFGRHRLSRLVWVVLFVFLFVNGTFGLSLVAWSRQESLLGETLSPLVSPFLLGLFLLALFNLPAFFLDYKRLHFIGFMFAVPIPAGAIFRQFFGIELGFYAFLIPAAAVIAVGLVTFLRFLQQHLIPAIMREDNDHVTN